MDGRLSQGNSGNYGLSRTYAGRRSYLDVFGAAVRGPIRLLPYIANGDLAFQPDSLFGDPNQSGSGCCATVKMTLRSHGKILKRSTTGTYGQFSARLRHSGWYNFSVSAKQKAPPGSAPAALSTMVTLSWRAHYDADLPQLEYTLPVSLARFEPQGLDMTNDAPPGGHTVTRMYLTRTGIYGYSRRYALRTILVAESVNGGRSWRQLQVTRKPGYWAVTISDPASGYVSLRATVTDVKGDIRPRPFTAPTECGRSGRSGSRRVSGSAPEVAGQRSTCPAGCLGGCQQPARPVGPARPTLAGDVPRAMQTPFPAV